MVRAGRNYREGNEVADTSYSLGVGLARLMRMLEAEIEEEEEEEEELG